MTSFDAKTNFAYTVLAVTPSTALTATSLLVQAGTGKELPTPPFNATVWPEGVSLPLNSNAEIVRVTARTGDTLTVERAQEGSTAKSLRAGMQFAATITAKTLTDIQEAIGAGGGLTKAEVEAIAEGKVKNIGESQLAAALLGPAANKFGLRKIGTGANEAMAGNTSVATPAEVAAAETRTKSLERGIRIVAAPSALATEAERATANTTVIQNAINEGAGTVQLWAGVYEVNQLELKKNVTLEGAGIDATYLKLKAAAKTPLLVSEEWASLKGTTAEGTMVRGGWRNITFEGNGTAPEKATEQGLVSIHGKAYTAENFWIVNAGGHALWSEWAPGGNEMEAMVTKFKIVTPKKNGIVWNGPHDSIVAFGTIQGAEAKGVEIGPRSDGTTWTQVHVWSEATTKCWHILPAAFSAKLIDCQGEGCKEETVLVEGSECTIRGGHYYGVGSTTPKGIVVNAEACHVETRISNFTTTCFEIVTDFMGYYLLDLSPHVETGKATDAEYMKGAFDASTYAVVNKKGGNNEAAPSEQNTIVKYPSGSQKPTHITMNNEWGLIIGLTGDRLGLFGVTPAVQPKTAGTVTGLTLGKAAAPTTEAIIKEDFEKSTFTGGLGTTKYTISDIVLALKQLGALKE